MHVTTFADLGLSESTLAALHDVGYESPSPIQVQGIPPLLEGRDVIGQAQTGSEAPSSTPAVSATWRHQMSSGSSS